MSIQAGSVYRRKLDGQLVTVISYTETIVQYQEQGNLDITGSTSIVRLYEDYEKIE